MCPRLIDELEVVLRRWKFRRYFTVEEADDFVEAILAVADEMPNPTNVEAVSRDPDDDYLIALARDSVADRLVSGDPDLRDLRQARFCFSASLPGTDTIHAFADTDNDGTQDPGEPSGAAPRPGCRPARPAVR